MLKKKEIIWREILDQTIQNKRFNFTQKELAQKYGFSLSTVFQALQIPRRSGAIKTDAKGFHVQDREKFLYMWATVRNLKKDIIYETNVSKKVREIEGEMPPSVVFGAFSAYVKKYQDAPADYDKVYVYVKKEDLTRIEERFPKQNPSRPLKVKGYANLIVLQADPWLQSFGSATPDVQTFVDLWNVPEWYAKDFLNALKAKLSF